MALGNRSVWLSSVLLALVAAPTALVAQSSTTSAIAGTVRDPNGKPLAGVTLRLSSPALLGGERVAQTTENGSYRFPMLAPGSYRIVVEHPAFSTMVGREVLELGKTSNLNFRFKAATGTTVEVTDSSASVSTAAVAMTKNFSAEELSTIPAERSLAGIMALTPGVNANQAWGGNTRENAYMMDGINVSDPSGGTVWIFPNMDWFSEVQMGGLGAPAEYGGFMGGYVNGLIKRGGNTLEGSFNAYYGDSKWQSRSSNNAISAQDKEIAPAKDWDVALNVGGPIIKDKVWFFASIERIDDQSTPIGAPIAQRNSKLMGLGKISWQARQSTLLEFLGEYDYLGRDRRGLDRYTLPIATVKEEAPNRSYSFTWTEVMGQDKVFTLKAFGFSGRYDLNPYNGEALPLDTGSPYNGIEYFNNTQYIDKNYRSRFTVSATFDLFKTGLLSTGDSHAFRMGIESEQAADEELRRFPGGINLNADWDDGGVYTSYFITGGGWNIRQRVNRMAAFIQDDWKVNDRLSLRPGLRFEQFKARFYGSGDHLWNKSTLAPRLGVKVALTADQANILNVHWGRYYTGYSTFFIDRAIQDAIPVSRYYDWGNYDYIDPNNPATWPVADPNSQIPYRVRNDMTPVDPNAKHPYIDETTLTLTHAFKGPWSLTASWVYRNFKDTLVQRDRALDGLDLNSLLVTYVNPITGQALPAYDLSDVTHDYVVANDSKAKRRYAAGTLSVDRKFEGNWSFNGSYTRSLSSGNVRRADGYDTTFSNPNLMTNADGRLPGYNDDEVKLRMVYELPWKMRISGSFTYLSGERWTPTFRTARIPDRYYVLAEARGSQKYPARRLLDLRVTQQIALSKASRLEAFVEAFNLLNSGSTLSWDARINAVNGSTDPADGVYEYYKVPDSVESARRLRLGLRVTF